VNVPLTLSEPEIVTPVQFRGSSPSHDGATLPFTVRQDDATVHVPTTSPPQDVPSWQVGPVPPVPVVPPLELPPVPGWPVPVVELHAIESKPAASKIAREADWTFILRLLPSVYSPGAGLRSPC
jgi:hypothetical protein